MQGVLGYAMLVLLGFAIIKVRTTHREFQSDPECCVLVERPHQTNPSVLFSLVDNVIKNLPLAIMMLALTYKTVLNRKF